MVRVVLKRCSPFGKGSGEILPELQGEADMVREYIEARGSLLVSAAGNCFADHGADSFYVFPGAVGGSNAIIVAGTSGPTTFWENAPEEATPGSDYDPDTIELAAPAGGHRPLANAAQGSDTGCYTNPCRGTSFSAPMVAGAAALLVSQDPDITPAETKQKLLDGATLGPGLEPYVEDGRTLNIPGALAQ